MWGKKKIEKSPVELRPCRLNPQIEHIAEKNIMRIDCTKCFANASLGNPVCLDGLLKTLSEKHDVTEIDLKKEYRKIFSVADVKILKEAADAIKQVEKENLCDSCKSIFSNIWGDPVYAYYKLKDKKCKKCGDVSKNIIDALGKTSLVKNVVSTKNADYVNTLIPELMPDIVSSFIDSKTPSGKPEMVYNVGDAKVSVYKLEGRPDMYYFVNLPEIFLKKDELEIISKVFEVLKSKRKDIDLSPENVRGEFGRHIKSALENIKGGDLKKLESIILRHTVGYGTIEPLLLDEKVQDVYIDSGSPQVHVVHADVGECVTNIFASQEEIEKLSTRLRALSKRPFDASSPVLHTELQDLGIRVCGICEPSTYKGTGFAFRKRKPIPWTLAEFVDKKSMDSEIAGLLSYLVDSQNSILITGPRSSGKTSLLTSLVLEMPRNSRIILIEDTPEMPIAELRHLGFKIEHLKTEAFAKGFEISTEDALRTSLRLGDSILVIGEVRGPEAKSLFEAMRVGAAGNVVLGTIHGSNAYDTFDRVVHDLGVPATSFKAVDFVVTAGLVKRGEDIRKHRRILEVAELSKGWTSEPKFTTIAKYNSKSDSWDFDFSKSEKLRHIASTKSISMAEVSKGIDTRAKIKSDLVRLGKKSREFLSPEFTVAANAMLTRVAGETGSYEKAYNSVSLWLKKQ